MYVYLSLLYGSNLFLLLLFSYFLSLVFFHWGIVALHCCVSFCCTMKWISCELVWVAQSCPTLCDCMDCSPPGFSLLRILQARILEWVAFSFSTGFSQPRDQTWVSSVAADSAFIRLPNWCSSKESACQCRRHKKFWFNPWVGNIPWRKKWQLTPVFLLGESHG